MKKWFKECPFCANEIKEKAIKCQYCWEFLPKEGEKKEEPKKEAKKETKDCPFCMNKVDVDATTCPFCDENLDDNVSGEFDNKEVVDEARIMSSKFEDLTEKEKWIRKAITYIDRAFGWWCFSILVTLIIYIVSLVRGSATILDVSIIDLIYWWVLVYFMCKRDRMAFLFFFIEFALSTILIASNWTKVWAFRAFVAIFLFMWIIWAFRYHSLTNQKKLSKSEKIILVVWIIVTLISIIWLIDMLW